MLQIKLNKAMINVVNLKRYLRFIYAFTVTFLSGFFSSYSAQQGNGNAHQPIIMVEDGAKIYSEDIGFNNQIDAGILLVEGKEISHNKKNSLQKVLVSKSSVELKNDEKIIKIQPTTIEILKGREEQKILAKEIKKHKSREKAFDKKLFNVFPSSEEFATVSHINQDYVAPNYSQNDCSKIFVLQDQYLVKSALDFLHAQKYTYYNSKSLDFCFSQVFSVRPPPVLG